MFAPKVIVVTTFNIVNFHETEVVLHYHKPLKSIEIVFKVLTNSQNQKREYFSAWQKSI